MSDIDLPDWVESLRPTQLTAISDITTQFSEGTDIVFYEAPTGTGKTLVAEVVRQELDARGLYLCSTISLQHQFAKDFPDAAILLGRTNYPTLSRPNDYHPSQPSVSISCGDCTKRKVNGNWTCQWCTPVSECPYEYAKILALRASLVCSNLFYFLYEANYVGALSRRDLVIVDECDTLEKTLLSFIQVDITEHRIREFGLPYPGKKTVTKAWVQWAEEALGRAVALRTTGEPQQLFSDNQLDLPTIRRKRRLENLIDDLRRLLDPEFGLESENWVYDGYKENNIVMKPIVVAPYAKDYLWKHGKRWLLMSATVLSSQELAMSLGLE